MWRLSPQFVDHEMRVLSLTKEESLLNAWSQSLQGKITSGIIGHRRRLARNQRQCQQHTTVRFKLQ